MKNFEFQDIRKMLAASDRVVIVSHHNPDGDAIGSVLAMYHFLSSMVKEVSLAVPNDYPGFLKWLEGGVDIMLYHTHKKKVKKALQDADVVFCLDFNSLHRAGDMENSLRNVKAPRILIDHHPEPMLEEFSWWFSEIETSSTAELVYHFIKGIDPGITISKSLAEALFVGIMTDTGSYSFSCNYPGTFIISAELIRAGVNAERVHRLVYDTYSESRLRLLGYAISQKMVVLPEYKTAYIVLTQEELHRHHYQVGDTEGLVNYALSIDGVIVAVLLTERKDRIRLSFRSKGDFSVNRIARDHFQGGGHRNAAGGNSFENMEVTVSKLKEVLQQYKEEIDRSSY